MKIERGTLIKVPTYQQQMWIELVSSLFEVMGANPHDDNFSLSDDVKTKRWYGGTTVVVPYNYVRWDYSVDTVEYSYEPPEDIHLYVETGIKTLMQEALKTIEEVL